MAWLTFFQDYDDDSSAAMITERLKRANVDETTDGLHFEKYHFDEDIIVRAVIDLFHRAFQKGCVLGLEITECHGRIDEILRVASSLDMFDKMSLGGGSGISHDYSDLSQHAFWSISAAMKFNKHLKKLDLDTIEMTRQQAAALGAGLVTFNSQNHFEELSMVNVTFADGAITELASGLKQNSSLCMLSVDVCDLGDVELAELVGTVESHPSLKTLGLRENAGQKHALAALGKVMASRSCRLRHLDLSVQSYDDGGLEGWLGSLVHGLQWNESLTRLDLSLNGLADKDIDHLGQILATCKLEELDLTENKITHSGFVSLTQHIPKSLKTLNFSGNCFGKEEAACHTLTLFEEHPQLWDGGCVARWEDSKSPIHQKIQHFKDLNRCGRILLVAGDGGTIPLSVWPIVLARANSLLSGDYEEERTHTAIFHLLQGPALMQRKFDRDSSQATYIEPGASERLTTSSKRGPDETIDQASAKKGRSE
jgi:hypothetical protein